MGLLDEWNKVKKDENNRAATKKWALTKGSPTNKTPYISSGGSSRLPEDVIRSAVERNTEKPSAPRYDNKMQFDEANYVAPQGPSLMEQLMERISASYQPMMPPGGGGQDANKAIMDRLTGQLDQALQAKLGAIGNVRNQAQQNFNTSDSNLAAMFGANANHIATQGSQAYGNIAQNLKSGITQTRDESLDRLSADRDASNAKRQAMLQALGIQEAGAQADPGEETMNNAMTGITNRSNVALQGADQMGATNQAYNQSVVNSVNQQGTERRAALMQQLQAIQSELGMAEAEAQSQTANQKNQLEMQRLQAEAQSMPSFEDYNKFGYQQFRDDRDLAFDLYKTLLGQQGEQAQPAKVQGFAGLGTDLVTNAGLQPEQASQYMAALSQVLGSEYMQGVHPDEGYGRADIIARRLMDEMQVPGPIAAQLATNYVNLGNNAYYTGQ